MDERVKWVDYAKAIGIILVVYGHVSRGLFSAGIGMSKDTFLLVDSIVYSFHMPLFFFLSGLFFFSSYSKKGGIKLTLNKLDTIIYPYIVWSIIQGTVQVILSQYTNKKMSFSEVFELWDPTAQFWFLYSLFFILLLSILIYKFDKKNKSNFILAFSLIIYFTQESFKDINPVSYIAPNMIYFALGITFTKYNIFNILYRNKSILLTTLTTISFIFSQYIYNEYLHKRYNDNDALSLLLACISILFITSISIVLARRKNTVIIYIGSSSMIIYLVHILAASGTRVIMTHILSINNTTINLIAGCVSGIFIPLLCMTIINTLHIKYVFTLPISKWLTLLLKKRLAS